jgi:hypothetical protein
MDRFALLFLALLAVAVIQILWQERVIAAARADVQHARQDAANARTNLTVSNNARDLYKEQAATWHAEAKTQLEQNKQLLDRLSKRVFPEPPALEDIPDPPTVNAADKRAAEARRAMPLRGGRVAVSVAEPDSPPVPRAELPDDEDGG